MLILCMQQHSSVCQGQHYWVLQHYRVCVCASAVTLCVAVECVAFCVGYAYACAHCYASSCTLVSVEL